MEKSYLQKIYRIAIAILIIVSIDFLMNFLTKVNFNNTTVKTESTESTGESSDYDVSMMNELTLAQTVKLFDSNDVSVVYLGRANCSACVSFLPTLQKMQSKYGYTTQYLDIRTVDTSSDDYSKLLEKLSKEVTLSINGETKTDKFSSFYGYTPMVFVMSKGKFVDGIVGAYSEERFETFLNNCGIK